MLTKEEYLKDPCAAAALPYWKEIRISVPDSMQILHHRDFDSSRLEGYRDEPYFRLKHDLEVEPAHIPKGFSLCQEAPEAFAAHIRACYGSSITAAEVRSFTERAVYCQDLWLAVREDATDRIVATGIGELDQDMGEGILEWIQVSEGYRRRGLGRFVVKELLWRMRDKATFATVSGQCDSPSRPEGLYRSCGFTGNDVWHVLKRIE